jgi:hypothetical protein
MYPRLRQSFFIIAILLLAGCSSTPVPDMFISHFNETGQSEEHRKCMNENAMFNNRQLMVAPSAVENAWGYCLNQFGVIAPGQAADETIIDPWLEDLADEEE